MFENQMKKGVRWSYKDQEHAQSGHLSHSNKDSREFLMVPSDHLGDSKKGLADMIRIEEQTQSPSDRHQVWPNENTNAMPFPVKVKKSPERFKFSKETMKHFNIKPDDLLDTNKNSFTPQTQIDFVHNNRKIA